jgi:SAM-dependent methyltransferase
MTDLMAKAPNFLKLTDKIKKLNPFQKKSIEKLLANADDQYIKFAESVVSRVLTAVDRGECFDYLAETYLWYTKLLRIEEMYYAQEGKYRYDNYEEVYEKVYSRDDYMFDYVVGLGLTQPLWANHYRIFRFFLDEFVPMIKDAKTGAEIGVGHGLFHSEAMRGAPKLKTILLDVSNTSLEMTRKMIAATGMDKERANPMNVDVQKDMPLEDDSLDTLLMGELIEHIQDGERVLSELSRKMKKDGFCYFSTAANAPAEDHILLFKDIGEIRGIIDKCNWKIIKEKCFTLNEMSVEDAEKNGQNINYCAVIQCK